MVEVLPREAWGWDGWARPVREVLPQERKAFVIHWDGAHPVLDVGPATLRRIDQAHRARGWAGIGYNFVVDRAGHAWEGRGWQGVGAHCPGWNRAGIGVQFAIGAGQAPSAAMLHAVRDLYDQASRLAGRRLELTWHGAHYPTECPGPVLTLWARSQPTPAERGDDGMLTDEDIGRLLDAAARHDGLLDAIADRLLSSRPSGEGGARYKTKDGIDPSGEPVLIGLTDAATRTLALLRQLTASGGRV